MFSTFVLIDSSTKIPLFTLTPFLATSPVLGLSPLPTTTRSATNSSPELVTTQVLSPSLLMTCTSRPKRNDTPRDSSLLWMMAAHSASTFWESTCSEPTTKVSFTPSLNTALATCKLTKPAPRITISLASLLSLIIFSASSIVLRVETYSEASASILSGARADAPVAIRRLSYSTILSSSRYTTCLAGSISTALFPSFVSTL